MILPADAQLTSDLWWWYSLLGSEVTRVSSTHTSFICLTARLTKDFQEFSAMLSYFNKNCLDGREKEGDSQTGKANKQNNSNQISNLSWESLCEVMCVTCWFSVQSLFLASSDFLYFMVIVASHLKGCFGVILYFYPEFLYIDSSHFFQVI